MVSEARPDYSEHCALGECAGRIVGKSQCRVGRATVANEKEQIYI